MLCLQVYQGKETSDHLLARLQAFKQGSTKEQQVYACMVHNLFDEYRFFPKYPEKERHITALLLGGLVRAATHFLCCILLKVPIVLLRFVRVHSVFELAWCAKHK